jgi:hypothetical protein
MAKKSVNIIIAVALSLLFCSPANNKTDKVRLSWQVEIEVFIRKYQEFFPIGRKLIWSIIKAESPYYPFQPRYEKHLKNAQWYLDALEDSPYKHEDSAYCSYGAMHVLYGVAYSMGYRGKPEDLMRSEHNLYYGMGYLYGLGKVYSNMLDIISSYNQGRPRKNWRYVYCNQNYVNKVCDEYIKLGGEI